MCNRVPCDSSYSLPAGIVLERSVVPRMSCVTMAAIEAFAYTKANFSQTQIYALLGINAGARAEIRVALQTSPKLKTSMTSTASTDKTSTSANTEKKRAEEIEKKG